ncbi:MAG: type IV secretion system DNA-binding domain-containing protein [Candidatus Paceibacterota bacterium]|jgi:hypothetical protein
MDDNRITYFAETDARNKKVRFGIKAKDRTRHVYVIGKTGMGKSTMLENMAVQDIQNGEGMCFIDPHGKTADLLLEYVPKDRIRDVIYIAPFDVDHPISFNVLESVEKDKRHLVSSGLMSTFKKIWEDAWSARMEYILTNTLLALLEYPGATLLGVNRMLSDKEFRKDVVAHVEDPSVKAFWVKEFANYTERMAAEAVPAIQNKVGQFTANPLIRNMIGQAQSSFDFREAMDQRKIIIINLSKGKIGDENMKLLGGLLVTKIYLAAMSRADVPDRMMKVAPNFYLYVDEFQNFANASFADILSEARKYKLNLTIAHQYIEQMDEIVRPAVFGNVGTMIAFRVGATDAEVLEKEFAPVFVIEDLVNLGFTQIYLKLMIDGLSSSPFSATTLPPIIHPDTSYVADIISASREQFSRARDEVEKEIVLFHTPIVPVKAPPKPAVGKIADVQTKSDAPAIKSTSKAESVISTPTVSSVGSNIAPVSGSASISTTSVPVSISTSTTTSAPTSASTPPTKLVPAIKPHESGHPHSHAHTTSKVTEGVASSEKVNIPPIVPPNKPLTPKSVPLSTLSPHARPPRSDPKVRSASNINDLKSALASVLAKSGNSPIPSKEQNAPSTSGVKNADNHTKQSQIQPNKPSEVPEEVLSKVLKDS